MKPVYRNLLHAIYENQTLDVLEVIKRVERVHNDHRDFYPLVGLISGGYIGTTLPLMEGNYAESYMAQQIQAISQGPGPQRYRLVQTFSDADDSYFYIAGKGLDYFAARQSDAKKLFVATLLSFMSALFVAFASEPIKKIWHYDKAPPIIKIEKQGAR